MVDWSYDKILKFWERWIGFSENSFNKGRVNTTTIPLLSKRFWSHSSSITTLRCTLYTMDFVLLFSLLKRVLLAFRTNIALIYDFFDSFLCLMTVGNVIFKGYIPLLWTFSFYLYIRSFFRIFKLTFLKPNVSCL